MVSFKSNSWSAKHAKDQLKFEICLDDLTLEAEKSFSPQHLSLAGVGGILVNYKVGFYNSLLIIRLQNCP
jgi:hypothetical protein